MTLTNEDFIFSDLDWYAIDGFKQIGHFTKGQLGPLPRYYLENQSVLLTIHNYFASLPNLFQSNLLTHEKYDFSDYLNMASKGLVSFNYCERTMCYIPIAFPFGALFLDALPQEIQGYLKFVCFPTMNFHKLQNFTPINFVPCI